MFVRNGLVYLSAYWGERPQLFAAIADGPTPEERHLRVVKWFIVRDSSLKMLLIRSQVWVGTDMLEYSRRSRANIPVETRRWDLRRSEPLAYSDLSDCGFDCSNSASC